MKRPIQSFHTPIFILISFGRWLNKSKPVGFYGFIQFLKPHTNFDLTIGLFYTGNKTKFNSDGTISPFWGPSSELSKKGKWLLKIKIPIEIED